MINKMHSKLKRLFPFAFVASGIVMLASCSSSNQMASSFNHRRYTTGHFSDPVAKIKTDSKTPDNAVALNTAVANSPLDKHVSVVESKKSTPLFSVPSVKQIQRSLTSNASTINNNSVTIAKTPVTNKNNNVSLNETPIVQDSPAYADHGGGGGGGGHHHYLLACFICILLWLLFLILAAGSALAGSGAGLGFFGILAYLFAIAAVVFFILWIVSLAS